MDHTLRILHLEDLPSDAELIERVLRKSGLVYKKLLVDNREDYVKALSSFSPDIVLSDHALPSFSSPEALAILKNGGYNIPFILITSTISEEFAVDIIKQGAADYILKDRLQRLPSAISNAVEINKLEKEKQQFVTELIASSQLMNEVEAIAHFGSFKINLLENTITLSPEAFRILGLEPSKKNIPGELLYNSVHPEDSNNINTRIFSTDNLPKDGVQKFHYRIVDHKGVLKYIYSECRVEGDEAHVALCVKGFIQDVTDIKVAESSLQKSEAHLNTILGNTDTAYVLFTPSKKIISFNNQANELTGELFGKELKEDGYAGDYFAANRMGFISEVFEKATKGENTAYETSILNREGNAKWFYSRWLGIADDHKINFGVMLAISDITERKLAELERERIASDLIKRNNALEQFAFIVSHNLRAPVANIMALTDALTTWNDATPGKDLFLNGLAASAKKLDEVVYDLNHILRVSQRINEQKEIVYFQQLVEDIKLALGSLVSSENVIIKTDFNALMNVYTLKSYLYNIFYTLILNSINFKQPFRSPVIEITSSQNGLQAQLVFKDNGRGINLAKYGKQIFGLYQRFDTSVEGRGMGLCMAKTQVETLGGKIKVESEINKGTAFTVQLPV